MFLAQFLAAARVGEVPVSPEPSLPGKVGAWMVALSPNSNLSR